MFGKKFVAAFLLSFPACAAALEYDLDAILGAQWESNALVDPVNEQDDIGVVYGLEFSMQEDRPRWGFAGGYDVTYTDYLDDLNDDETQIVGGGDLVVRVVPQFFEWGFSYTAENERRELLAADNADNRERRQVFATQPVLFFRLGDSRDRVITSLRYVKVKQEDADNNDSDRYGASLGWERRLSAVSQLSLNSEYSTVDFVAEDADYDLARIFVSYAAQLRVLSYNVQLGVSHIDQEIDDSLVAEYVRFEATHRRGVHAWTLGILDEVSDTSLGVGNVDFALNINNRDFQETTVFDAADLITERQATLGYVGNVLCRACSLGVSLSYVNLDYENSDREEDSTIGNISLRYSYSDALNLFVGASHDRGRVSGADIGLLAGTSAETNQTIYLAGLDWQLTRRLSMDLTYSHEQQETPDAIANDPGAFGLNFDNDRVFLRLRYNIL